MFGKPISEANIEDLKRLIRDAVPEGQHLEYKEAVSVHTQQQRDQLKIDPLCRPIDKAVEAGTGIADHGRNALLEELVAFANADGGVIVLGMAETEEDVPRAASIAAIPHVAKLERRLQDHIIELIEPRLPYAQTKSIPIGEDGQGVLLIETHASTLGPHWVKSSRLATIRRGEKCSPLSMPELHDMVLRNSRRTDEVRHTLDEARTLFATKFSEGTNALSNNHSQLYRDSSSPVIFGIRSTIIPHQPLGLHRFEQAHLIVKGGTLTREDAVEKRDHELYFQDAGNARQILGGVECERKGHERISFLRAERNGSITAWVICAVGPTFRLTETFFLGIVGSVVATFDRLRIIGGAPNLVAEIEAEITAFPQVRSMIVRNSWEEEGHALAKTVFPSATISDVKSFNGYLNSLAGDYVNAIGFTANHLPRYSLRYRL